MLGDTTGQSADTEAVADDGNDGAPSINRPTIPSLEQQAKDENEDDGHGNLEHGSVEARSMYGGPLQQLLFYQCTDQLSNSTRSMTESLIEEVYENGRRYANETYAMPNDEQEQTRLNICHQYWLRILDDRLTTAPLDPSAVRRVLDVGTGAADWAINMAEEYPNATVIATDIAYFDLPPSLPPNLEIEIDDIEQDWPYSEPFDFIHIRAMSGAISDWPRLYRQCWNHLRPGGWIEVADWNYSEITGLEAADYLSIYASALRSAHEVAGAIRDTGHHLDGNLLRATGFSDLGMTNLQCPLTPWRNDLPKWHTVGKMSLVIFVEGMEANSLRPLTKYLNWSPDEVRDLIEKVSAELQEPGGNPQMPFYILTARKPRGIPERSCMGTDVEGEGDGDGDEAAEAEPDLEPNPEPEGAAAMEVDPRVPL